MLRMKLQSDSLALQLGENRASPPGVSCLEDCLGAGSFSPFYEPLFRTVARSLDNANRPNTWQKTELVTMTKLTLGIDVSKQNLDVFDSHSKKHHQVPNTPQGIQDWMQNYADPQDIQVIIESTGIYQRLVHQKLEQAGFKVYIVNPYKARCFAKSAGFLAKTDKVDAKMLCHYGQKVECRLTPYASASQQELESLVHYKDILKQELQRLINQQEYGHVSSLVQTLIQKQIKDIKNHLKQIESRLNSLLDEDDDFKDKTEKLETVPGVGKGTISTLLCYLPELGSINRKELAALVGVAPLMCESGAMRGKAMIKGGRAHLRKALYMPVLSCIRCNQDLRKFYERLRQNGKPAKVALIAVMRKLIITLNVMIKTNSPWREKNA